MARKLSPLDLFKRIDKLVRSAHPPVEAFERGIRATPFRVLVSVLISSRTRDGVTHEASKRLFERANTPGEMSRLGEAEIAGLIYPAGFYRQKARHIKALCGKLMETGKVPDRFDDLVALPGVGRKTANLVLALAFNRPAVAVDTHVFRITRRLGWARGTTPEQVESELKKLFPVQLWNRLNQVLVGFGQTLCTPRHPDCSACPVGDACPSFQRKPAGIKK